MGLPLITVPLFLFPPTDFIWRTELDLFSHNATPGQVTITTVSHSPYSNASHVHIDSGEHREAVAGIFEKTHLIDQFHSQDEMGESLFEKIEMDPDLEWHNGPPETSPKAEAIPMVTPSPPHAVPRARADDYEAESFEPEEPLPKHNRRGKNKHHQGNRSKKGHHEARRGKHHQQLRRDPDFEEDFDSHLELKPERNLPFDRLNSFEMSPESIQFEVNKNGRRHYQSQRPSASSDVHVVQPEEPVTVSFNSKIIDIRTNNREKNRRVKREAEPSDATATETQDMRTLRLFLDKFFGNRPATPNEPHHLMTLPALEFINLVVALTVWSARYPSIFWATSKPFSLLFSLQMIANGLSILYDYLGCSILYKLQGFHAAEGVKSPTLLLNSLVTLSLCLLSVLLLLGSSHILYMYGHGKLSLKMRERRVISVKSSEGWIYFSHCSSLCFVLALAVVKAPLLHDLTVTYRQNLNGTLFASGETHRMGHP